MLNVSWSLASRSSSSMLSSSVMRMTFLSKDCLKAQLLIHDLDASLASHRTIDTRSQGSNTKEPSLLENPVTQAL